MAKLIPTWSVLLLALFACGGDAEEDRSTHCYTYDPNPENGRNERRTTCVDRFSGDQFFCWRTSDPCTPDGDVTYVGCYDVWYRSVGVSCMKMEQCWKPAIDNPACCDQVDFQAEPRDCERSD